MARNLLNLVYIFVAIGTLMIALTATAANAEGVTKVTCNLKPKGSNEPGTKSDKDVSKSCCKKANAECRRRESAGDGYDYFCLARSKAIEQKVKDCCDTTTKSKPPRAFRGVSADGSAYANYDAC